MGIDSETANAKYIMFETEMRRRLWWSLVLFDSRIMELSGIKSSSLVPTWVCKPPLNLNDCDLWPGRKWLPEIQARTADTLFVATRCELGEYIRHAAFYLDFTMPILNALAKEGQWGTDGLNILEQMVNQRYLRFCDLRNPLQFMASCVVRGTIARYRLMEHYSRRSRSSPDRLNATADWGLPYAISMLDCDTEIMTSSLSKGFLGFTQFYFPTLAYICIVRYLRSRPLYEKAGLAWDAMADSFDARFDLLPSGDSLFHIST
jgi:hypothetical protein